MHIKDIQKFQVAIEKKYESANDKKIFEWYTFDLNTGYICYISANHIIYKRNQAAMKLNIKY